MIRRWAILGALLALYACGPSEAPKKAPVDARARADKPHKIGWLSPGGPVAEAERKSGDFLLALRDLGYVERQDIVVDYRYAAGDAVKLAALAADLVRQKVDVIVAVGESAALAAKHATSSIPIVAIELAMDPVKAGVVTSLRRPEANVTGLATRNEELWQKRLDVFKLIAPKASRMVVLWNPANPGNVSCVDEIKAAAPTLGLKVALLGVGDVGSLDRALAVTAKDPPDALLVCWDSVTLAHARRIAELALRQRLPTVATIREYVDAGMLMSQGASLSAHQRGAARYVDKLLKGAKPGSLPVEQAAQFDSVLNDGTAKGLGIAVPPSVRANMDDVVK